jgi:hypothetical protein
MGSKGSLHVYEKSDKTVNLIYEEYTNSKSKLNKDPKHNGYGTPMIVTNDYFISV